MFLDIGDGGEGCEWKEGDGYGNGLGLGFLFYFICKFFVFYLCNGI